MNRAPKSMDLICLQNIYTCRKYNQSEKKKTIIKKQKIHLKFTTKKKTPTNICLSLFLDKCF